MAETTVTYEKGGELVELPIRFLGPDQNFVLQTEPISHRMSANVPPRLLDLLEIASAIFCADSTVSRGGLTQPHDGKTWRRNLRFNFAVRDIAFWEQSDVSRLLRETVEFMTDDRIECTFTESVQSPQIQSYLNYTADTEDAFQIDDVVLFSGGLDSLSGALETLSTTDRRIALVTHRSAPKTIRHQDELIKHLRRNFGDRFLWVPVLVHRKGQRSTESTQRSRSLLFAALGCVVARMLGANQIQFFENGIVSQNLPLARPITGTLATRTTHPQTLKHVEALLSEVCAVPLDVSNKFEWRTKSEVVKSLKDWGYSELLRHTVSCNHTFKRKSDVRHCGSCTQCLDRKFAVLANDLGKFERDDDYATDVLFGTRERDDQKALTVEWVRHARRLSAMSEGEFRSRFMSELLRITRTFDDKKAAMTLCYNMHKSHGDAVMGVLVGLSAPQVKAAPQGSIASEMGGNRMAPPVESTAETQKPMREDRPLQRWPDSNDAVLEVMQSDGNTFVVLDVVDFTGIHGRLLSSLLDVYLEDRARGLPLSKHRCLKAREIADQLHVSEDYVRTEVKRIRQNLKEAWNAIHEETRREPVLIKTVGKRGYQLDRRINVVLAAEMH